ncbi:hypothetical protein M8A51_22770 [Schlegelella sp. S2-27]|uniref:Uncharacterized protein n=1 Tax=Caldimonas mangrovi TaxID=2944811 RepID=A0ABT0YUE2_9BURK|nr:hypothetical protein [Caldimonas mangrovi]MCM5682361.1 hypothetical protein [Caldimonas mangrovi]
MWERSKSYAVSRWRGQVHWPRAFFWDMLLVGTFVNLAVGTAAMIGITQAAPPPLTTAAWGVLLPYNVFLLVSVWRSAAGSGEPWTSALRLAALGWCALAVIL